MAGGLLVKSLTPKPQPPVPPVLLQQHFRERLKKELDLSAEQTLRIDKIFVESGANMKIIWDLIGPEVEAEKREVRDKIRGELTPEQRAKFEDLLQRPPHRFEGRRGPRGGTNQTSSTNTPGK